jgi:hypothetical protein
MSNLGIAMSIWRGRERRKVLYMGMLIGGCVGRSMGLESHVGVLVEVEGNVPDCD